MFDILVAGEMDGLGLYITQALMHRPDVNIRVLVPTGTNPAEHRELSGQNHQVFSGHLRDTSLLHRAMQGADAVISTVHGFDSIHLFHMSVTNAVPRFVPACHVRTPADHDALMRLVDKLKRGPNDYTLVLNGAFMEDLFSPEMGIFDFESRKVHYWGDGDLRMDVTSMRDAAEWTVAAALDADAANAELSLAGDTVTLEDTIGWVNELTSSNLERVCKGTVDELQQLVRDNQGNDFSTEPVSLQYQWMLFSGATRLKGRDNARYPDIYPTILLDYIAIEL